MNKRTYKTLDALRLDDNRVMVRPDTPGHRTFEEYVPVTEVEQLKITLKTVLAVAGVSQLAEERDLNG